MSEPTREELLQAIQDMEAELTRFRGMVKRLVPEKEWYSTSEFAAKKGLAHKTICNYLGRGKYKKIRKNNQGNYEIHESELDR